MDIVEVGYVLGGPYDLISQALDEILSRIERQAHSCGCTACVKREQRLKEFLFTPPPDEAEAARDYYAVGSRLGS